jgi:hypothetical protein
VKRRGPSNDQLREYAATLRDLAQRIQPGGGLVTLLERDARLAVPDGFGPGTLGGRASGKSDPTSGAALARGETGERDPAVDFVHGCATRALAELDRAIGAAHEVARLVEDGFKVEEMVVGRDLDSEGRPRRPDCVEQFCEEPSAPGREGRCEPCYRWRKRWRDKNGGRPAPPVPADVIELRKRSRERAS